MPKLAVPVSGTGSILDAMIKYNVPINLVIADRPCRGLTIAKEAGIQTEFLPRKFGKDFDRKEYTRKTVQVLESYGIGLIAMAGYMTVLDDVIFLRYRNRLINIHPSLLPSFKGETAVKDALAWGVKVTGTTIHFATEELDQGPIIAQEAVPVLKNDTVDTLWERIKVVERRLYPTVVRQLLNELA